MTKIMRAGEDITERPDSPTAPTAVSQAQRTPGPWELSTLNGRVPAVREITRPFGEASCYESSVRSASGEHVCKLDFGYGRKCDAANAAFIVRACNHHETLVAALRRMLDCHQAAIDAALSSASRFVEEQCDCGACSEAREAIANAEGK